VFFFFFFGQVESIDSSQVLIATSVNLFLTTQLGNVHAGVKKAKYPG